jgi:hypothetical protein
MYNTNEPSRKLWYLLAPSGNAIEMTTAIENWVLKRSGIHGTSIQSKSNSVNKKILPSISHISPRK